MKPPGYEKEWPDCEIEATDLSDSHKEFAWKLKETIGERCDVPCWPGRCSCAARAAEFTQANESMIR